VPVNVVANKFQLNSKPWAPFLYSSLGPSCAWLPGQSALWHAAQQLVAARPM